MDMQSIYKPHRSKTLYRHGAGPLMTYGDGMLYVCNLNPQVQTEWRMSRLEMFWLALRCIAASIRKKP
jgi:hypothetical protein